MTQLQIDEVLDSVGVLKDKWVTLQGIFNYIILDSDRTLFCDAKSAQFFFPTDKEFFLIRNSSGRINSEGNLEIRISSGGKIYEEEDFNGDPVGIYHDIISIGSIAAFMKK